MGSYASFSEDAILHSATSPEGSLEDVTGVAIPRGPLPTSASTPTEEEATKEPAPLEVASKEAAPTEKPFEGPTHLLVAVNDSNDSAEGLTTPQAQPEEQKKMEAPHGGYPSRTKVLHPPWLLTAVEPIPPELSGSKGRHDSQSSGGRRSWH